MARRRLLTRRHVLASAARPGMVEIIMTPACRAISCGLVLVLFLCERSQGDELQTTRPSSNPFYALENGVKDDEHATPESQAELLKRLGFAGMSHSGVAGIPERLAALDRHGLTLYTVYVQAHLDPDKPKYDPRLPEVITQLMGRQTMVWLTIQSGRHKPSSHEGDERAVEIVRELADAAGKAGVQIALYPHFRFWLEGVEDAVRIAGKVNRPNVGVTFNLAHWLRKDRPETLRDRLSLAEPFLFQVTINGADPEGDWDHLIQPLDRGSFDVSLVLKELGRIGYAGPIGLQCYGIKENRLDLLSRSIAAWERLAGNLSSSVGSGPGASRRTPPQLLTWMQVVDAAQTDPSLGSAVEALIRKAREEVEKGLMRRPYRFEDIGKHRSWLDKRAHPLEKEIREKFALAMSDHMMCWQMADRFPGVAAAAKLSGDAGLRTFVSEQLREISGWRPLQRPGWTLYTPGRRLPPDGKDGNWLATGTGVRGIVTVLEIMGDSLEPKLRDDLRALLEAEVPSIIDDWESQRPWFVKSNNAITNQWVLPSEGLVRACLYLGRDRHSEAYELGVRNLLAALSSHGQAGEFEEGIHYARFTTESLLHTAHAMAVAGDRRAIDHPFLVHFSTWAAHHFQPGRMLVNCFDAVGSFVPRDHAGWRSFLSMMVFCSADETANWTLHEQLDGPSDDLAGLACRFVARNLARNPPPLFAAYERAAMVVWRDNWRDDGNGVWIRGGHALDQHDHRDRGHVNLIQRGKPILIEAGTPDYSNPSIAVHYQSDAGHNVLRLGDFFPGEPCPVWFYDVQYEGWQRRGCVAPIEVGRLGAEGGSVTVDATRCYPALEYWRRNVTWSDTALTVLDDVRFKEGIQDIVLFRWHLGTEEDVTISVDDRNVDVNWADARIRFSADAPLSLRQFKAPDATVTFQFTAPDTPVAGRDDRQHTCLELRSRGPVASMRVTTTVR